MRNFLLFLLISISQLTAAQVTKNVGDFDEVKVFDRISVYLVPSNENKVEVSGHRSKEVEVVNNNGTLKIRMSIGQILSGDNVEARVYYKSLRSIDASEGSIVSAEGSFSQDKLQITSREGSEITLKLEVKNADVKAVTGGIINLSGSATQMDATIGTGGELRAKNLVTSQSDVSIRAGGNVDVFATDLVDTNIKAGGDITIYGNPATVNESTTLGGSVTIKK